MSQNTTVLHFLVRMGAYVGQVSASWQKSISQWAQWVLNPAFGDFPNLEYTLETCPRAGWALGEGESHAYYKKWVPCFSAAASATQLLPELRVLMADLRGRWTLQAQERPRGRRSPGWPCPRGCPLLGPRLQSPGLRPYVSLHQQYQIQAKDGNSVCAALVTCFSFP